MIAGQVRRSGLRDRAKGRVQSLVGGAHLAKNVVEDGHTYDEVETRALSDLSLDKRSSLIKVDAEGAEGKVLQGVKAKISARTRTGSGRLRGNAGASAGSRVRKKIYRPVSRPV